MGAFISLTIAIVSVMITITIMLIKFRISLMLILFHLMSSTITAFTRR